MNTIYNNKHRQISTMSKTGIIYKLVSRDVNIKGVYVGSTCNFRTRKCNHKKSCTNENDKQYKLNVYQYIRANGGWDLFDMIQIEEFKHDTVRELRARERYWIEQLKATLNKCIPTRTQLEWVQDNTEVIAEYHKQYYKNNKEAILENVKQYKQNNIEAILEVQKAWRENNKDKIVETSTLYWQINKGAISEKQKQKYTCGCGSTISISNKSYHNKSAKHMAWAATLPTVSDNLIYE